LLRLACDKLPWGQFVFGVMMCQSLLCFVRFFLPEASFSALLKTMLLKTIPGLTLPGIGTPGQFLSARPEFSGQPWCLNN